MQQDIEGWRIISKKTKTNEIITLVIMGVMLLVGIVLQCVDICMFCKGCSFFEIFDVDASLVILQIHGTISTLSITVITLINGSLKDSLYGISVTDFFMNRKPHILTQKRNMIITFLSVIVSFIMHLYGMRWMVLAIYFSEIVLIIYSSLMMYAAFRGLEEIDRQIRQYVVSFFDANNDIEEKKQMLNAFINDWIIIKDQNIVERERYKKIYDYAIDKLLYDAEVRRR